MFDEIFSLWHNINYTLLLYFIRNCKSITIVVCNQCFLLIELNVKCTINSLSELLMCRFGSCFQLVEASFKFYYTSVNNIGQSPIHFFIWSVIIALNNLNESLIAWHNWSSLLYIILHQYCTLTKPIWTPIFATSKLDGNISWDGYCRFSLKINNKSNIFYHCRLFPSCNVAQALYIQC